MNRCKFCKNETNNKESYLLLYFCDSSCRNDYIIYKEYKLNNKKDLSLYQYQLSYNMNNNNNKIDDKKEINESIYDIIKRTGGYPILGTHRGGGFEFGPENTMYSFKKGVYKHKVRLLELDIWLTKDNHLVIMHFPILNFTTDGSGFIWNYTLKELRKLNAANKYPYLKDKKIKIPTLEEFLNEFIPIKDLLFFLDFKDELTFKITMKYIEKYNIWNRIMLGSVLKPVNNLCFKIRDKEKSISICNDMPICTTVLETFKITILYEMGLLNDYKPKHNVFGFILLPETIIFWSKNLVDKIHKNGYKLMVCGAELRKPEVVKNCIEWSVEFILMDCPNIYNDIMKELNNK